MSEPLAPDALAEELAEIYLVVGPLYRRVARIVEADQAAMGMSVGVRAILNQLRREGDLTVPQMAHSQELSRQFVQRMANDAEEAGFVQFIDNPAHRRSRLIRLTASGQRAIGAVAEREHLLMGQVGGDLTEAEVRAARRVLAQMLTALEDVERS